MTAYAVSASWTIDDSNSRALSVTAVSYDVKIIRVDVAQDDQYSGVLRPVVERWEGGSASGGSATSAWALRQGSPAATVTCRQGVLSVSGTGRLLAPLGAVSGASSYEPPSDIIISPGTTLRLNIGWRGAGQGAQAVIYLEEMRLSWHY